MYQPVIDTYDFPRRASPEKKAALREKLQDHKPEVTPTSIEDVLNPLTEETGHTLTRVTPQQAIKEFNPNKQYGGFDYDKAFGTPRDKLASLNSYMMGSDRVFGFINLYSGKGAINKDLLRTRIHEEPVVDHEAVSGHPIWLHDEVLTRIHTNTTDVEKFSSYAKYGP